MPPRSSHRSPLASVSALIHPRGLFAPVVLLAYFANALARTVGRWSVVGRSCLPLLFCLVIMMLPATVLAKETHLAFGQGEEMTSLRLLGGSVKPVPPPTETPLGSLWKLFVFLYLEETGAPEAPYRCTGRDPKEEVYCCEPKGQIEREAALVKSCGLYFSPTRLNISPLDWRKFWQAQVPAGPEWLYTLSKIEPATKTSVPVLLNTLGGVPPELRLKAERALQRLNLSPPLRPLLASMGSQLRVKTWSWFSDAQHQKRIGGFGGWLADGTPVWLSGVGTSVHAIERAAPALSEVLPFAKAPEMACVNVNFFTRYPIKEVFMDNKIAEAGRLKGKIRVIFENGQTLAFSSGEGLSLIRTGLKPKMTGRFSLNEYVARVLQREVTPTPREAARAFAIAIRTYLVRHAAFHGGCYEINDDSRTQRVSPAAPTEAARHIAHWSDGLVIKNADGRYHSDKIAKGLLSWARAKEEALLGTDWITLLQEAYGPVVFGLIAENDAGECRPLYSVDRWLQTQEKAWHRHLQAVPGYERPKPFPKVCQLDYGNPYADIGRGTIYVKGVSSLQERLSVVHEYLHFALAYHPRGYDEAFVERTARLLLGVE